MLASALCRFRRRVRRDPAVRREVRSAEQVPTAAAARGTATLVMSLEANGFDPALVNPTGITYGTRMAAVFDVLVYADQRTGESPAAARRSR
ncbi:hypothetical protein ACU686_23195 [Yinghuangia aomiensis]